VTQEIQPVPPATEAVPRTNGVPDAAGRVRVREVASEAERPPGYAGFVTRTIALAIDAALIDLAALVVAAVAALVLSLFKLDDRLQDAAAIVGGVLFVLWTVGYFVAFWSATGETPGNRAMRIRVSRADGSRLRPRHALVRLGGMIISLPLLWGYLPVLVSDRRRGVHDVLAGTVVRERPRELVVDPVPVRRPASRSAAARRA
jgi:uncharacterized RDD family membrane protein YckC